MPDRVDQQWKTAAQGNGRAAHLMTISPQEAKSTYDEIDSGIRRINEINGLRVKAVQLSTRSMRCIRAVLGDKPTLTAEDVAHGFHNAELIEEPDQMDPWILLVGHWP